VASDVLRKTLPDYQGCLETASTNPSDPVAQSQLDLAAVEMKSAVNDLRRAISGDTPVTGAGGSDKATDDAASLDATVHELDVTEVEMEVEKHDPVTTSVFEVPEMEQPKGPMFVAAKALKTETDRWSEKDNPIISTAKGMAELMGYVLCPGGVTTAPEAVVAVLVVAGVAATSVVCGNVSGSGGSAIDHDRSAGDHGGSVWRIPCRSRDRRCPCCWLVFNLPGTAHLTSIPLPPFHPPPSLLRWRRRKMAQVSNERGLRDGGKGSSIIIAAKDIADQAKTVVKQAREVAQNCSDKRIKTDLLYLCDRIPTISTQLKIISSVKAAAVSGDNREADAMLVKNAQVGTFLPPLPFPPKKMRAHTEEPIDSYSYTLGSRC